MLPNVIGIGAQRSGTTWIYEMLKKHPQVCMSPEKEINFFNTHYNKKIEWYENFFEKCGEEKIVGEFSPRYLSHELVPQRMKKIVPEAKIIVSLRNPADQVFSRYCYMVSRHMYANSFEAVLKEKPSLIEDAFYFKHLKRFMECFGRNQILILIYDDLAMNARYFLEKIYSFLDIDSAYIPSSLNERVFPRRVPRSKILETYMVIVRIILKKTKLFSVVEELKARGIDKKIKQLNTRKNRTFEEMSSRMRNHLNHIFADDKQRLSELIGRDLSSWK